MNFLFVASNLDHVIISNLIE